MAAESLGRDVTPEEALYALHQIDQETLPGMKAEAIAGAIIRIDAEYKQQARDAMLPANTRQVLRDVGAATGVAGPVSEIKSDTDWSYQHFVTPEWACAAAYGLIPDSPAPGLIYDFGAGTGVWGRVAKRIWPGTRVHGFELDDTRPASKEYDAWVVENCATVNVNDYSDADLIVSNPPFSLAGEFVRRALEMVKPNGGRVLMLLRMAFLESARRESFWAECPPELVAVYAKRPSFTGNGHTDTKTAYAAFLWRRGHWGPPVFDILSADAPHSRLFIGSTPYRFEDTLTARRAIAGE